MKLLKTLCIGLSLCLVVACGDSDSAEPNNQSNNTGTDTTDDTVATPEDLTLTGSYVDNWGTEHTIDNDLWIQGSSAFQIISYDNETGTIIAQNDSANEYNPDLWSRFDWATVDGQLWYCQTAYAAETEEAAIATPEADATSPAEAGCGGFSWTQLNEPLAIRGDYGDSWGGEHTITQTSWVSGGASYTISQFDNEAQFIIAQNGDDNEYNPGLWSRFDWAAVNGDLWYCQTAYDAESEDAALATEAADATNPAEAGCGGFGWTQLVDALAIRGSYGDSWGGAHTISQSSWVSGAASYTISQFDNDAQFIIAQNSEDNEYNPGLWSRFDWASVDGALWYCQTAYDAESEEAALATPAADAANPAETGCGGFSWTQLTTPTE